MPFIPNPANSAKPIPFFEDSTGADAPGKYTEKSIEALQLEIVGYLGKLGAIGVYFIEGLFDTTPKRYGYAIHFSVSGVKGYLEVAALPLKKEENKNKALATLLYMIRDRFKAQALAYIYEPGSMPLAIYLIGANGKTVLQNLQEAQVLLEAGQ